MGKIESKTDGTSGYGMSGWGLTPVALTGTSVSTLTCSQVASTNGGRRHYEAEGEVEPFQDKAILPQNFPEHDKKMSFPIVFCQQRSYSLNTV